MSRVRTRTRSLGRLGNGSYTKTFNGSGTKDSPSHGPSLLSESMTDTVGNYPNPNALAQRKDIWGGTTLNGSTGDPKAGWYMQFKDYFPNAITSATAPNLVSKGLPPAMSRDAAVIQTLKRSNPSRPEADLAVAIGELRDAPSLLRNAGENLLQFGTGFYLKYQFGVKPLVSDISALIHMHDAIEMRKRELTRLYSNQGLKRRIQLASDQYGTTATVVGTSVMSSVYYYTCQASIRRRVWATVRWLPDEVVHEMPSNDRIAQLAKRALRGMTIDLSTAWNLMPWTWLIDWGSNAGDFLLAYRNIIGARPSDICIMTETFTEGSFVPQNVPSWANAGNLSHNQISRSRVVTAPVALPELQGFGVLTSRQAGILSSLGVNRVPREALRRLEPEQLRLLYLRLRYRR